MTGRNHWEYRAKVRRKFPVGCRVKCVISTEGDIDPELMGATGLVTEHGDFYGTVMTAVSFARSDSHGDVYWLREDEIELALPPIYYDCEWDYDSAFA